MGLPAPAKGMAGFTLLEVLVALAIVAVAATAALALSGDLLRRMADARERDQMAILAWNVAGQEMRDLKHPGTRNGTFDPPHDLCRWAVKTESLQLGAAEVLGTGAIESGAAQKARAQPKHFLARFTITCENRPDELVLERLGVL